MPRTTFAALPLFAALALLPGEALAGPPEGASGKMVLEGSKVSTPDGLLIIRKTPGGMAVEGPLYQGSAKRITWQTYKGDGLLLFEGTASELAVLTKRAPAKADQVITAEHFLYSLRQGIAVVSKGRVER